MAKCAVDGCNAYAVKDSTDGKCFSHSKDPEIVEKRRKAHKKGGYNRARSKTMAHISIDTVADVKRTLSECVDELRLTGTDDVVCKNRAIGYLLKIALDAIAQFDFEERIDHLEEVVLD